MSAAIIVIHAHATSLAFYSYRSRPLVHSLMFETALLLGSALTLRASSQHLGEDIKAVARVQLALEKQHVM